MFNKIKDKFKRKSALKFLKTELQKPIAPLSREPKISAVACLVDLDKFDNATLFYEFIEAFNLRPNAVKVIGYKSDYDKNSPYATPVFSDRDLGWRGEIDNSYVQEFLSREYDLLVNYYNEDNLLLEIMTVRTKARIRVGFNELDSKYNDLIFVTPLTGFKIFKNELKKYLKILNEID